MGTWATCTNDKNCPTVKVFKHIYHPSDILFELMPVYKMAHASSLDGSGLSVDDLFEQHVTPEMIKPMLEKYAQNKDTISFEDAVHEAIEKCEMYNDMPTFGILRFGLKKQAQAQAKKSIEDLKEYWESWIQFLEHCQSHGGFEIS